MIRPSSPSSPSGPSAPSFAIIAFLCVLAFVVLMSYAIVRPASESLFLKTYGSSGLPAAWIVLTFLAAGVVTLYSRFAGRVALLRLFLFATGISGAVLVVLLLLLHLSVPGVPFLLYQWKDLYIIVLVEIFWSFANVISRTSTARWTYGLFCVMGSLGGIVGNLGGGALAQRVGTEAVLWLVLPILCLAAVCCLGGVRIMAQHGALQGTGAAHDAAAGPGQDLAQAQAPSMRQGIGVVRSSAYLVPLLGMVAVVQVVTTLIDMRVSKALELQVPLMDARTAVIGKIYAAIDVSSIGLQLLTGPILRFVGVESTLLAIPLLLGGAVGLSVVLPRFSFLVLSKVTGKAFDYSLFRAAKEILYIPLSYAEKTQGKALVDMFTYRAAKGGASLLILALLALQGGRLLGLLALCLIGCWLLLTVSIVTRYRGQKKAVPSSLATEG